MVIIWDEHKRTLNIQKHGLDFALLDEAFFVEAAFFKVRGDRIMAVNRIGSRLVSVVVRPLGSEAISVISMRPANKREMKRL